VNGINDVMLFSDPRTILTKGSHHGWLSRFPEHECPKELHNTSSRIEAVLSHRPFCLKDPRFSYTLPVWKKHLFDVSYICVIRHPGAVVNSIMQNCKTAPYLSNIEIDRSICYDIWANMYNNLLCLAEPDWLFLHYNQILGGSGLDCVENLLETEVNKNFPTSSLCRSKQAQDVPICVMDLYNILCDRAGYKKDEYI